MELLWTSAAQRGGCFIVDATRQGKRFPDSFSKTIPIWACVLNRAVCKYRKATLNCEELSLNEGDPGKYADFDQASPTMSGSEMWDCSLHLPLWVSDTESEEIERRIDKWVDIFWAANADIGSLSKALRKPLQPLWISQNTVVWLNEVPDAASWTFTPIILVSASQPIPRAQRMTDGGSGWNYIPGAADDEESWARGLTPALFWKHALSFLEGSAESCNKMVADLVERDRVSRAYRGLEANQVRVKFLKKSCDEGMQQEVERFCETKESIGNEKGEENQSFNLYWIGETNLAVGNALCGKFWSLLTCVAKHVYCIAKR